MLSTFLGHNHIFNFLSNPEFSKIKVMKILFIKIFKYIKVEVFYLSVY